MVKKGPNLHSVKGEVGGGFGGEAAGLLGQSIAVEYYFIGLNDVLHLFMSRNITLTV